MASMFDMTKFDYIVDVLTSDGENIRIPISKVTPDRMDSSGYYVTEKPKPSTRYSLLRTED